MHDHPLRLVYELYIERPVLGITLTVTLTCAVAFVLILWDFVDEWLEGIRAGVRAEQDRGEPLAE